MVLVWYWTITRNIKDDLRLGKSSEKDMVVLAVAGIVLCRPCRA